jgi:hypothetical protein
MDGVLVALRPPAQPPAVPIRHGEEVTVGKGVKMEATGVANRLPVRAGQVRPQRPYLFSSALVAGSEAPSYGFQSG